MKVLSKVSISTVLARGLVQRQTRLYFSNIIFISIIIIIIIIMSVFVFITHVMKVKRCFSEIIIRLLLDSPAQCYSGGGAEQTPTHRPVFFFFKANMRTRPLSFPAPSSFRKKRCLSNITEASCDDAFEVFWI
ncbi:hypothetical protein JOB18_006859 [Solea senegalensis]|uniref:Uncharacterized protein n=1 Tax=Solea senegalensis TaxID=28829 RepID=A0AAV6PCQ9_SOLSE|nr:hypothetical protein JOB18_006859 [Solea senegalensis]